uniref:Uncharacterized protein n=1 Tax=Lates calcarifer TaxID=8187 RepID=A0A4W6F2C4_LATCA
MAAKLTSQDPLIIRPISAGVLLTATADRAVSPTLPAKYMTLMGQDWVKHLNCCHISDFVMMRNIRTVLVTLLPPRTLS